MPESLLMDPVRVLKGSNKKVSNDSVLINKGKLQAFGEEAREVGKKLGLIAQSCPEKLLAPCLVDPHSVLEEAIGGRSETLQSLRNAASLSGYGQIALLPRSPSWRDQPDRLIGFSNANSDVKIHLWGSFSLNGEGRELSPHADLLENGALGLSEDNWTPSLTILQKGLLLGEMGKNPILLAARNKSIQGNGIVREGVEVLRAGWSPDPIATETLPLGDLLQLQQQFPKRRIRIMNLSTAEGVEMLSSSPIDPMASVDWWHLIADNGSLTPTDLGWTVCPSLGNKKDQAALIKGLQEGDLTAVAVNAIPMDEEESQLPADQRMPGLAGHNVVLPSLWQKLVVNQGWSIESLWKVLSFGPSRMLCLKEESLETGSNRWLLFDPKKSWIPNRNDLCAPKASNQPLLGKEVLGKVISCGLEG